jgi:hypothetical protein
MQNAISCNAKAIFKMESHDFEGAFNLLRTSMLSLTNTLHGNNTKLPCDVRVKGTPSNDAIVLVSSKFDPSIKHLYSGSFLFSLSQTSGVTVTNRQVDYCSAACLFNMGLACHLEFESSQDPLKRDKLLQQARILYLTAYQILQKYPIEPTDNIIMLLMALCSNVIEVEMELGAIEEVRFWSRILEDASFAADPVCFTGTSVYTFFDNVYVSPGDLIAAKAA